MSAVDIVSNSTCGFPPASPIKVFLLGMMSDKLDTELRKREVDFLFLSVSVAA